MAKERERTFSRAIIEHVEERRLLSTLSLLNGSRGSLTSNATLITGGVTVTRSYKGDANLDGSVNVFDLLAVALNYGKPSGATWSTGDFNYDGKVSLEDMLALAFNYGAGEPNGQAKIRGKFQYFGQDVDLPSGTTATFVSDWAMVRNALQNSYADPANSSAGMAGNRLIVEVGSPNATELRSTTSKNGVFRAYADEGSAPLIEIKAAKIAAVSVLSNAASRPLKLDDSFPAADIVLGSGNDHLIANDQPNTIYGGAGDDTIYAGGGDDVVYGDAGNDRIYGEGGDDTLFGGAHKDRLDGGIGKNVLVGGSGTDSFTVRSKDKIDREERDHLKVIS